MEQREKEREEVIHCGAVIRAFGYRGTPIADVPWDETKGIVPTAPGGRVVANGEVMTGLYACGWLRRGASGIIGTNMTDAEEVAAAIHQDFVNGTLAAEDGNSTIDSDDAVLKVLRAHGIDEEELYDADSAIS